jgi:hypothetical protein
MKPWPGAKDRSVTDVGPGDYVKVAGGWEKIVANTATGATHPREWTVTTEQGEYGMFDVYRYAKAEDFFAGPPQRTRYEVNVKRYGALGILELDTGVPAVPRDEVQAVVELQLDTMCPGDRALIEILVRP